MTTLPGGRTTRTRRRAAIVVGALGLTLAGTAASAVTPPSEQSDAALGWLQGQVGGQGVYEVDRTSEAGSTSEVDAETTIDVALAEVALGRTEAARALADGLADRRQRGSAADDYLATGAAAYARTLALATAVGADATDFGGNDLTSGTALVSEGPAAGRLDAPDADVVDQAYAVRGLGAVDPDRAASARAFLLQQQCPGGGFRLDLPAPEEAQACSDDTSADPGATAAVVALLAGDGFGAADETWMRAAADHLARQQRRDGAFLAGGVVDAALTGSAARALGATCRIGAAQAAGAVVAGLQVPTAEPSDSGLAADTGAVAPSEADLAAGRTGGIGPDEVTAWRRATGQAAPALTALAGRTPLYGQPGRRLEISTTFAYVRAGSLQTLTVANTRGERYCLEGPTVAESRPGSEATEQIVVRAPRGTADRTYAVSQGPGVNSTVLRVLDRERFTVTAPRRRAVGETMSVVVDGVASGERVTLRVRRGLVEEAFGNRRGRATFRGVDVVGPPGLRRYVVRGKFGDIRWGSAEVRVGAAG